MKTSRLKLAGAALLAAALACAPRAEPRDIPATVNAVSTQVQATLQAGATLAPAPTLPPQPTLGLQPPTSAPATSTASPTSTPAVSPTPAMRPGNAYHAPRLTSLPVLDGDLSEWALRYFINLVVYQPVNWSGVGDLSADLALAWDDANLYLAARVTDDLHVQTQSGAKLYQGDSLEVLLDADLAGDFSSPALGNDDFQIGFSPGNETDLSPEAWLWFPAGRAGPAAGAALAARRTGAAGGYALEAAVPWSLLGLSPRSGLTLGFAFSVSDNDAAGTAEQQSLISTAGTRRLSDPTTWGTLILDP